MERRDRWLGKSVLFLDELEEFNSIERQKEDYVEVSTGLAPLWVVTIGWKSFFL